MKELPQIMASNPRMKYGLVLLFGIFDLFHKDEEE
jgi:hypothetical protein